MAKYKLNKHDLQKTTKENGYTYIDLTLNTTNSDNNESRAKYTICADTNHPDIDKLYSTIKEGLDRAISKQCKIGKSDYKERNYLFLELPDTDGVLKQIKVTVAS